jgi:hypothetical protein
MSAEAEEAPLTKEQEARLDAEAAAARAAREEAEKWRRLKAERNAIVADLKSGWSSRQEWGRYEKSFPPASRIVVPKVSRVQLGETIDGTTRPPHRVSSSTNACPDFTSVAVSLSRQSH